MSEEKNIKAFNYGYELAKHDNNLALAIIGNINDDSSEKLQFMKEGVIEYEKEKLYDSIGKDSKEIEKGKDRE